MISSTQIDQLAKKFLADRNIDPERRVKGGRTAYEVVRERLPGIYERAIDREFRRLIAIETKDMRIGDD